MKINVHFHASSDFDLHLENGKTHALFYSFMQPLGAETSKKSALALCPIFGNNFLLKSGFSTTHNSLVHILNDNDISSYVFIQNLIKSQEWSSHLLL